MLLHYAARFPVITIPTALPRMRMIGRSYADAEDSQSSLNFLRGKPISGLEIYNLSIFDSIDPVG